MIAAQKTALELSLVAIIALAINLVGINHNPMVDELHHVLAARTFVESGTLQVADGDEYTRAQLFTYMVAGLFKVFGESWTVARLPAAVAGAATVTVLFAWLRKEAGRMAAWIAAGLLMLYPVSIYLSQLCRFYTLQSFTFLLGTWSVFEILNGNRNKAALGAVAACSFAIALHLQTTTVIGLAGIVLWAGYVQSKRLSVRQWAIAGGMLAATTITPLHSNYLTNMLHLFNYADMWAESERNNFRYYHWQILGHYPTLWTLFPALLIVAFKANRRLIAMCSVVFATALILHSAAAWKQERYLFYVMPFFFAICGVCIAWLIKRAPNNLVAAGVFCFAALGNPAFSETYRMLMPEPPGATATNRPYRGEEDWSAVTPQLKQSIDKGTTIISSSDLKALYYLGNVDYVLLHNYRRSSTGEIPEFGILREVNRPVISTPRSLAMVVNRATNGIVVVIERVHWNVSWGVPPTTAQYLLSTFKPIPLPPQSGLMAFKCEKRCNSEQHL